MLRKKVALTPVAASVLTAGSLLFGCGGDSNSSPGAGSATGGASAGNTTTLPALPASCETSCNAATASPPLLGANGANGNVTMYSTEASVGGACLYGNTNLRYYAAINVNVQPSDGAGEWQGGRICGQCVKVTVLTRQGLADVVVRITDRCADANCGLDLGGLAPALVQTDGFGRYSGTWEYVSCLGHDELSDGPTALFVKEGSSAYWSAVQVRNPAMAVTAMHWQNLSTPSVAGDFTYAGPGIENYYLVPTEVLQGKSQFKVTVAYRDGSLGAIELTSEQLAIPEASYPLL